MKKKHVTSVDVNTLAHTEALRAHVFDVVVWVTKSPIAQRLHGIVRVIFRDQEWESTQRHNEVAQPLVLPQGTIEATRSH